MPFGYIQFLSISYFTHLVSSNGFGLFYAVCRCHHSVCLVPLKLISFPLWRTNEGGHPEWIYIETPT